MNSADHRLAPLTVRHAAFPTRSLEAAIAFYRDVLGFQPYYVGSEDWAMLANGDTSISLIRAEVDRRGSEAKGGSHHQHLGLTVPDRASVEAWHQRLKTSGVRSVGKPSEHRDGSYGFYFRDLDGNPLELIFIPLRSHHQPAPKEAWLIVAPPMLGDVAASLRAHVPGVKAGTESELAKEGMPAEVRVFSFSDGERVVAELRAKYPKSKFVLASTVGQSAAVREAVLSEIVNSFTSTSTTTSTTT